MEFTMYYHEISTYSLTTLMIDTGLITRRVVVVHKIINAEFFLEWA